MTDNPCLAAALEYARLGWAAIRLCTPDHKDCPEHHLYPGPGKKPCTSPGKAPMSGEGWNTRRLSEKALCELFAECPRSNAGVVMGLISGLISVDVDSEEGEILLHSWAGGRDKMPPTCSFVTPGHKGSYRLLYRWPEGSWQGIPIRSIKGSDGYECLKILSGLQTVMPPSVHPNGQPYIWHPGCTPWDVEPAPCPEWLIEAAYNYGKEKAAPVKPAVTIRHDEPHYRNTVEMARKNLFELEPPDPRADHGMDATTQLLKGASRLAKSFELDEDTAVALLAEWDAHNPLGPYPEKELRRKYREAVAHSTLAPGGGPRHERWKERQEKQARPSASAASQSGAGKGDGPPVSPAQPPLPNPNPEREGYQPFPLQTLPGALAAYVDEAALSLGCDPAYIALPMLAVAASLIGNTRVLRLKRGWDEPSVLWTVLVADSGTMKTPAYCKAVGRALDIQHALLRQYRRDKKAADDANAAGGKESEPVLRRVVVSDITIEEMAKALEENPRGLLRANDELRGWLTSFTRYSSGKGSTDLPQWLEMHRAGTLIVDRKTGDNKHLFVRRAAVSVTGTIQPNVLCKAMTDEFLDSGLAARLLMAHPPKLPKRWTELFIHPDTEKCYDQVLDRLLSLSFDLIQGEDGPEQVPHALHLSPEAKDLWVEWYNDWADEQAMVEGELASAYSKLEAYAARFALVHHVVDNAAYGSEDRCPVQAGSVRAGIELCQWFAREARRVYASLSETDEQRSLRTMIEFIRSRGGQATARDLMRASRRKFPTAIAAEGFMESMVKAGLAGWLKMPTTGKGGRPTWAVVLAKETQEGCDTTDTTDTTPDVESVSPAMAGDITEGPTPDVVSFPGIKSDATRCNNGTCDDAT